MSLIFCGDTTVPFSIKPGYDDSLRALFAGNTAIANLEGAILTDENQTTHYRRSDKYSLYSSTAVTDMLRDLDIRYVSLCNNHIRDYKPDLAITEKILRDAGTEPFGLRNHDMLRISDNGREIFIFTFATCSCEHALNLFSPEKLLRHVKEVRAAYPDARIVIFPHWGRERFYLPEPADRELAHRLADSGADIIVGHHPHIIQPVETYRGVQIIYSIGNFFLARGKYGTRTLVFPEEMSHEIIVKWDGESAEIIPLHYDADTQTLSADPSYDMSRHLTALDGEMTDKEYARLYSSHFSLPERLLRTRFRPTYARECISHGKRSIIRTIRRLLIASGLHTPK